MTPKQRDEAIQFCKTRAVWWLAIHQGAAMAAVWCERAVELEASKTERYRVKGELVREAVTN